MAIPSPEELTEMTRAQDAAALPEKYVDASMFTAAPMEEPGDIKVHLLWMTPDPLGAIAAACRMYEGKVTYSLGDITNDERRHYLAQVQETHLKAPLEFVNFHFMLEGVDRAFTHQMVRQRTAVFAQESMRFAVKDNMAEEAAMPPSIERLPLESPIRQRWVEHLQAVEEVYKFLVGNDIPAEDARGILPHVTTTRLNYHTNLRNLSDHAGNRLCTQAQFVWREVFTKITDAIAEYEPDFSWITNERAQNIAKLEWRDEHDWQFQALAKESGLFRPACYQLGHCPFKADFDRGCTIRGRVDAFARAGITPSAWGSDEWMTSEHNDLEAIQDEEWALDPTAAWQ